jgi:hypothetical protein|tara:strand:- start:440 stop:628 length:189 start_codon:yes stop_codon:yes gene_type:complete
MIKNYYVAADKITARISDDVNPGYHIRMKGVRYENVSKRPLGKSIVAKLVKPDESEMLFVYN